MTPDAARALTSRVTEKAWQQWVVDAAKLHGWWVHHHHDSRRSEPGWPDLVLLRPPDALFVELKAEKGKLTREQRGVLDALNACGLEAQLWRPSQWRVVDARLSRARP